jgi:hypothetical protein
MNGTATLYLCPQSKLPDVAAGTVEGRVLSCPSVDCQFPQLTPSPLGLSPEKTSLYVLLHFNVYPFTCILTHVTMVQKLILLNFAFPYQTHNTQEWKMWVVILI